MLSRRPKKGIDVALELNICRQNNAFSRPDALIIVLQHHIRVKNIAKKKTPLKMNNDYEAAPMDLWVCGVCGVARKSCVPFSRK